MNDERRKICDSVNALVARRVGETPLGPDEPSDVSGRFPVTSVSGDDDCASCFAELRSDRVGGLPGTPDTTPGHGETTTGRDNNGFRERLPAEDDDDASTRERLPTHDDGGDSRTKRSSTARRVGGSDSTPPTDLGPENRSRPNARARVSSERHSAERELYDCVPLPGDRPGDGGGGGDDGRSSSSSSSSAEWFADFSDGSADSIVTADSFVSCPPSAGRHDAAPASFASAERPRESYCRIV